MTHITCRLTARTGISSGTLRSAIELVTLVISLCVETAGSKRSHWTRLCGALTMLVLLGVPWMFSAFAVIDATTSKDLEMLQGVFNVSLRYTVFCCFNLPQSRKKHPKLHSVVG